MNTETTEGSRPVAGQVERPVRPSLSEALDAWWDAAYVEGRDGRTHDTEGGAAQQALQDIWAAHQAALVAAVAAAVAAERERCAAKAGEYARKWWTEHCRSNHHMATTRKAHDDFCALQVDIRRA